jgi:ABC-2 type transport system permease protein
MRLFFSGLRKLVRRPATWVTVGLLIGLLALIILAVGAGVNGRSLRTGTASATEARLLVTFPGAYDRVLQFITGLGGLFAVIYGAAIAGSEWSWGTFKSAVARGESRVRYMLTSYVTVAVMIAFGILLTFAVGVVAAIIGAHLANVSTDGLGDAATLGDLPERLLKGWVAVVEEGALGFTIATLARSQLAGIGAGIALYFGEGFAAVFLPDIVKYLPFSVANASLVTDTSRAGLFAGGASALPADQAQALVVVWLIGALIVAAVFSDRAEVAG